MAFVVVVGASVVVVGGRSGNVPTVLLVVGANEPAEPGIVSDSKENDNPSNKSSVVVGPLAALVVEVVG